MEKVKNILEKEGMSVKPIAVNVETAARMTSLSPHTIRNYIKTHRLQARHMGRRLVIPVKSLEELIESDHPSRTAPPDMATNKEQQNP